VWVSVEQCTVLQYRSPIFLFRGWGVRHRVALTLYMVHGHWFVLLDIVARRRRVRHIVAVLDIVGPRTMDILDIVGLKGATIGRIDILINL